MITVEAYCLQLKSPKANEAKLIWPNTACKTGREITKVFCYGFTHYKWHTDSFNYLAVNSFKVKDQGKSVLKSIFPQEVAFYIREFQDRPIYQRWCRAHPASGYGFVWGVIEADLT